MSSFSKVTLWVASGTAFGIIFYVHYKQWVDKKNLREGVIRDVERQQKRKVENLYFLQQQTELSKILKEHQSKDDAITLKLLEDTEKR